MAWDALDVPVVVRPVVVGVVDGSLVAMGVLVRREYRNLSSF